MSERLVAQHSDNELPPAVGLNMNHYLTTRTDIEGRVIRLNLREGFDISVYDIHTLLPQAQEAMTEPCLSINVILKGTGSATIVGQDICGPDIPYESKTTYVCVMHKPLQNIMHLPEHGDLVGIDIRLSFEFLNKQQGLPNLAQLTTKHPWHRNSNQDAWVGFAPSSHTAIRNAEFLVKEVFLREPNDLAIEGKALAILSETLSIIDETLCSPRPSLGQKQIKLIENAHEIMIDDLAHPWTIRDLARKVGLNEKTFKSGFKQRYGQPVFQYIQQQRLEKARELLANGDVKVSDVSQTVGYANPSHFAWLFRRQFGISPSQVTKK